MTGERRLGVVSVILVNFRGADDTITCVRALRETDWPQDLLEIIVVENGSGDDSRERLRAVDGLATVVVSKVNGGFTGGCNFGASQATGEFIAFLNNDARPDSRWIAEAVDTFAEGKDIGAVASKVLDWEGRDIDYVGSAITWYGMGYKPNAGVVDDGSWDTEKDVLFGTGAAMFIRAELFERLGGFDDRYFMFYEDVDLGWRLNLLGYRFRYQPRSLAFHRHHASMEKFGNYHETYLLERNALYTLYKNLDDASLARYLPAALLLAVRRGTGRARRDTMSLDLRRADDDGQPTLGVSKELLAGVDAIDQLVERLPELTASRRMIQETRLRSDRQLAKLFGEIDEPAYPIDSYLEGYEKILASMDVLELDRRTKVLIITGDPIGERMAGPAIRAWNMAEELSRDNEVRLVSLSSVTVAPRDFDTATVSVLHPNSMNQHESWADVIVLQGHALALFPVLDSSVKPLVVDVYDPLHLEVLEQGRDEDMKLWSDRVDDATGVLNHQLARGDFFLCASQRQRHFWLGQLAALGRINPLNYRDDPDLDGLIAVVPFGIPVDPPLATRSALRGAVPGIDLDSKIIIWGGGIYDWFDPETLIRAVGTLAPKHPEIKLFFMGTKHPNPVVVEAEAVGNARSLSASLGLTDRHVFFNESWVDYDQRQDYLLDADLGVSTHFQHVETTFSFRTRILDYLWAGLPIVTTEGDSFGDLVSAEGLGVSVPERDEAALVAALESLLFDQKKVAAARKNVARVRERFTWPHVLEPLTAFAQQPHLAADREPSVRTASRRRRSAKDSPVERAYARRHSGIRRDLSRVRFYLEHGGPAAVIERFRARRRRAAASE